jgi:hypothetical protein
MMFFKLSQSLNCSTAQLLNCSTAQLLNCSTAQLRIFDFDAYKLLKRPIKNRADLQVPKWTPDSQEVSVIKIETSEGLNQLRSTTNNVL